jgi:hypothetical protein
MTGRCNWPIISSFTKSKNKNLTEHVHSRTVRTQQKETPTVQLSYEERDILRTTKNREESKYKENYPRRA